MKSLCVFVAVLHNHSFSKFLYSLSNTKQCVVVVKKRRAQINAGFVYNSDIIIRHLFLICTFCTTVQRTTVHLSRGGPKEDIRRMERTLSVNYSY